jgi:hypothetical protein
MFLKKVESNKKMIELLFEHFKDKPNDFEESMKRIKEKNTPKNKRTNNNNNKTIEKNLMRRKSVDVSLIFKKYGNSSRIINKNLKISNVLNSNIIHNNNNNNISININNNYINKQKRKSMAMNSSKQNLILDINNQNLSNKNYERSLKSSYFKEDITNKKKNIFPYKYYIFSIFIKNLDISKQKSFFSSRFSKIYSFYCQLFDITTYLLIQREFNALKALFHEKDELLLEKNKKVCSSYNSFIKEINDLI